MPVSGCFRVRTGGFPVKWHGRTGIGPLGVGQDALAGRGEALRALRRGLRNDLWRQGSPSGKGKRKGNKRLSCFMTMDASTQSFLQGGGECGALLRRIEWSVHPLGPPSGWPDELATLVGMVLRSKQPMFLAWGPERIMLYNDAYGVIAGKRHPEGLGQPMDRMWFDIWDKVGPLTDAAYAGTGTATDEMQLVLHRNGYPETTYFAFSYNPVRDRNGTVLGMFCSCVETTAAVAQRDAQRAERSGFMQVFEVALGAVALLDGPDHVIRYANRDYYALVGRQGIIGKPVREALPEVADQGFIALMDQVFRLGESQVGRNIAVTLQSGPMGALRQRYVDYLFHPMRDEAGAISGMFVQALDVTERMAEDQQRQLILGEMSHRMKNQLAMIQAIVNQTFRTATNLSTAGEILGNRIRVLSGAHDILVRGRASGATVAEIVATALALHEDGGQTRFEVEGPDLTIDANPALSLSLILHELSTNATKYGALSSNEGRVHVAWGIDRALVGPSRFVLRWTERGGPSVTPPEKAGTGSRLIEAGLSGAVDCAVRLDYHPDGLRCRIGADLASVQSAR